MARKTNTTCKQCGRQYHHCSSCGGAYWEGYFCDYSCVEENYKQKYEKTVLAIREKLSTEEAEILSELLTREEFFILIEKNLEGKSI